MRKTLFRILLTCVAAGVALGVGAASVFAQATWTITPGGVSTSSGTVSLSDNGNAITCTETNAGTWNSGSGQAILGTITSLSLSNCTQGLGTGSATCNASTSNPWTLTGGSYNPSADNGQTTGTITASTDIGCTLNLTVLGSDCAVVIGGSAANFLYDNGSGQLQITNTDMSVSSSSCPGFNTGDSISFTGTFTISPSQTITSP